MVVENEIKTAAASQYTKRAEALLELKENIEAARSRVSRVNQ